MSIWRPDPTFYPSPKMAMDAPAEKLAYVAMVNGKDNGRHDAMGVVDVDPASSGYGHIVGQVDMPHAGDELTAAAALLVYQKFGLAMLRRSWFNLDLIWAITLVVTGFVALLV